MVYVFIEERPVLTDGSRNCTKHNCRCDYMDQPPATEEATHSPRMPDLQMTPEIERQIEEWRMTGEPPFSELQLTPNAYWHRFSGVDLRLIHHIAGMSIEMQQRGYSGCTVWAHKMSTLVRFQIVQCAPLTFGAGFYALPLPVIL